MDEQEHKDSQDMVVGSDGSMNDGSDAGQKIEVKMDTAANSENTNETSPEPVNDVSPPPEAEPTKPTDAEQTTDAGSESVEVKQPPTEADTNEFQETSDDSSQSMASQTSTAETNHLETKPANPEPTANLHGQKESIDTPQKPHEHRNNKKLALITTLVVALILAGGAVYMYLSTQNNAQEGSNNTDLSGSTDELTPVDNSPATADDVDQATKEAEDAINALDDSSDFSEESLSDQNLGL